MNVLDTGSGFPKQYLMVGAGETKRRGQIGQFREGLKGAMCVAARNKRAFTMATTGFRVEKVAIEDVLLGSGGFVLYVDFEDGTTCGTDVSLVATEAEVREALRHFNGVKCRGIEVEECKFDGAIAMKPKSRKGKVFINNALACEVDLLFDYNFTEETLKGYRLGDLIDRLKSGQNRDREVVHFDRIEYAVRSLLGAVTDPEIIRHYMTAWEENSNCREYRMHGTISGGDAWKAVAMELWPGKVCQPPKYSHFKGENEREHFLSLVDRGWNSLPDGMPDTLRNTIGPWFPTVTTVHGRLFKETEETRLDVVSKRDWTPEQRQCMQELQDGLVLCFGLEKCPEFRMYARDYEVKDSVGLWWKSTIWLRRDYVDRAVASPLGFAEALGTVGHEYAHGKNGHNGDRTRQFEHVLTDMIGLLMAKIVRPDFQPNPKSVGQKAVDLSVYTDTYSYAEILQTFADRGREVKSHLNFGPRNECRLMLEDGLTWHHLGSEFTRNKTGISEEHSFGSVDLKGRACFIYFRQPIRGRVLICGGRRDYAARQFENIRLRQQRGVMGRSTFCRPEERPFRVQELQAAAH